MDEIVRGYNLKTYISICDGKITAPLLQSVGGCERCRSEFYVRDDDVTEPKTRVRCPHCGFVQDRVIYKCPMSINKLQGLRANFAIVDEWLSGESRHGYDRKE